MAKQTLDLDKMSAEDCLEFNIDGKLYTLSDIPYKLVKKWNKEDLDLKSEKGFDLMADRLFEIIKLPKEITNELGLRQVTALWNAINGFMGVSQDPKEK